MGSLYPFRTASVALIFCALIRHADAATATDGICPLLSQTLEHLPRGEMPEAYLLRQSIVTEVPAIQRSIPWDAVGSTLRIQETFDVDARRAVTQFAEHMVFRIDYYQADGLHPFVALSASDGGTLHCKGMEIFVQSNGRYAHAASLPGDQLSDFDLCWDEHARIVAFEGEPLVLVSREDPSQARLAVLQAEETPAMTKTCDLQIDFDVDYDVDPATCSDATCRQMVPALIRIARKLDDGWPAAFGDSVVDPADVPAAVVSSLQAANSESSPAQAVYFAANFDDDPDAEFLAVEQNLDQSLLAYFVDMSDGAAKAPLKLDLQGFPPSRSPWTTFTEPSYLLPMSQGGKVYLVHIGAGSFSWRTLEGYLATAYEWSDDGFNLIAGAQLNRVNASVRAITELR